MIDPRAANAHKPLNLLKFPQPAHFHASRDCARAAQPAIGDGFAVCRHAITVKQHRIELQQEEPFFELLFI